MIDHVVARGKRENQRRGDAAKQIDALPQRRLIVDHETVALAKAMVRRADQRGCLPRFLGAAVGNRPGRLAGGSTVAGRGGCDMHFPARLRQPDQRSAAENFGVIGMGHEGKSNTAICGRLSSAFYPP